MDKDGYHGYDAEKVIKEATKEAFDLGWNTALVSVATAMENMKALGDTATSFAAFVREFRR
jgi:hypothetical protein